MWKDLKECIQNMKPSAFEKLAACLLESLLGIRFSIAQSGNQDGIDAISSDDATAIQAKRYKDHTRFNLSSIERDIRRALKNLSNLEVYVLAASRRIPSQLRMHLNGIEEKTGLDIVPLELSDELSDIGALCVTFWKNVRDFDCFASVDAAFSERVQAAAAAPETQKRIEELRGLLGQGIQTYERVQKDAAAYLRKRFGGNPVFNPPIDLGQARERLSFESDIGEWWQRNTAIGVHPITLPLNQTSESGGTPLTQYGCYLEGKKGTGKSWLAAKCVMSICAETNVIPFWLDREEWYDCKSLTELLRACLYSIYRNPLAEQKDTKLLYKIMERWSGLCLIVLDGINEEKAIESANRLLGDYLKQVVVSGESERAIPAPEADLSSEDKRRPDIRFLLTMRPGGLRSNFERWCSKISVCPMPELRDGGNEVDLLSSGDIIHAWPPRLSNILSEIFKATGPIGVKDLASRFRQELEPIPSEELRTEALFVALQLTAISPPDIPPEQLSQKRAALMHARAINHPAWIHDARLSFWVEKDIDAYTHVVELQLEESNYPNYESALIVPLARVWREATKNVQQLEPYLTRWLRMPANPIVNPSEEMLSSRKRMQREHAQTRLAAAALSILSQRPEPQFLETLARCAAHLRDEDNRYGHDFDRTLSLLMRWGYTEAVVDELRSLAEQADEDSALLKGVQQLAAYLRLVELPLNLQQSLSAEEREWLAQWQHRFRPFAARIRARESLFTNDAPVENANASYSGLGELAVRTDLPELSEEDRVQIEPVLRQILPDAGRYQGRSLTLAVASMEELMPWLAKDAPKSYATLACEFKVEVLKHNAPLYKLHEVQGVIFEQNDCAKITEAIRGMQQRLAQGDTSSENIAHDASLLTQILLFSATEEDELMAWFDFLAEHETLRASIAYLPIPDLLQSLLPESVVRHAQQKVKTLPLSAPDSQPTVNDGTPPWSEQEYWCALYAYGTQPEGDAVTVAVEELKRREPNADGTFPLLCLALSEPHQNLAHAATDERLRRHLFAEDSLLFTVPIYGGDDAPTDERLKSLPPEIVGSFLCSPDRRTAFSRWGRDLLKTPSSILQGPEGIPESVEESRFTINRDVLRIWVEQHPDEFLELAGAFLSQGPRYPQVLMDLLDAVLCLLLRFKPSTAMEYYLCWEAENARIVYHTYYRVPTFLVQLWRVGDCNSPEHRQLRRSLLEGALSDYNIMHMTLAALAEGGQDELWELATQKYLKSPTAKERNLGVSILPWFGTPEAIQVLKALQANDASKWVREHAEWAAEVAQYELSCRQVYRDALKTRDLFRISAVFEQLNPALSPTALWWHHAIEEEELGDVTSDSDTKLHALLYQFWYRWSNSLKSNPHREVFGRKLRDYCRGEKLGIGILPRIAPWWEPR